MVSRLRKIREQVLVSWKYVTKSLFGTTHLAHALRFASVKKKKQHLQLNRFSFRGLAGIGTQLWISRLWRSRGIGFEIAHLFALQGAKIIICGRNYENIKNAGESLKKEFGDSSVQYFKCDVSSESEVKELFQKIYRLPEKKLDVLVCNAGILDDALIGMVSVNQINKVFSINTFGILYFSQYASRLMARNKDGGNIHQITFSNQTIGMSNHSLDMWDS